MILYVDSKYVSPYAMSAYVALREKGVSFEIKPVNLQGAEHRSSSYAGISGTQRVPTLSEEDFNLSESSAICEYVNERFPGPAIYPADPRARAKAREVQAWLRSDLMPIRGERPTEVVFLKRSPAALSDAAQAAASKLFQFAERLIRPSQQNLFGDWCIADTDLALMLNRLIFSGESVPESLVAYAHQQWQRPSVQEWVGLKRPIA
jgi:glutathione S-transferase